MWDYSKLKTVCIAKEKGSLWTRRKHLQTMYLIKDSYSNYLRNSIAKNKQNKKQVIQFKWAKAQSSHFSIKAR